MRVGKAGSDSGICWKMVSFIFGKMGIVLPFEMARPFWCTFFVGMLTESRDVRLRDYYNDNEGEISKLWKMAKCHSILL